MLWILLTGSGWCFLLIFNNLSLFTVLMEFGFVTIEIQECYLTRGTGASACIFRITKELFILF